MIKSEFTTAVCNEVRKSGYRKSVNLDRKVFHISDDDGNKKDFVVQPREKHVVLNQQDVGAVIDAFMTVLENCVSHGETVSIVGFGKWELRYHHGAVIQSIHTGGDVWKRSRYVLKFTPFGRLKECVGIYNAKISDGNENKPDDVSDDEDQDGDE